MNGSTVGGIIGTATTMILVALTPKRECVNICGNLSDSQSIWILLSIGIGAGIAGIFWKVFED